MGYFRNKFITRTHARRHTNLRKYIPVFHLVFLALVKGGRGRERSHVGKEEEKEREVSWVIGYKEGSPLSLPF